MASPPVDSDAVERKSQRPPLPPGAWKPALRIARRVLTPVDRFMQVQAASGIVLMVASALALIWANSPWHESYAELWHTSIGVHVAQFSFERSLHFWINDGLMTIFFFLIGLEIRREMHNGELRTVRRAALPMVAALGGMLVPAAIYAAFNHDRSTAHGWGVAMATDIAFAVGVLALLGTRVQSSLRVLLLGLAVIDDVGAILVIALAYSTGFSAQGVIVALLGMLAIRVQQAFAVRSPWAYVPAGILMWAGVYAAGAHPTLAGVVAGLMTPVRAWYGEEGLRWQLESAKRTLDGADAPADGEGDGHGHAPHLPHVLRKIGKAHAEALSPVERLEHSLHRPVAYGIMPLFAFANAGVEIGGASMHDDAFYVFAGIALGLLVGKPLGVLSLSWAAKRLGLVTYPTGSTPSQLALIGTVAGIGFTMALFIAQLAFKPGPVLETAKLAVLSGSAAAAVLSLAIGLRLPQRASTPSTPPPAKAERAAEAHA